MNLYLNKKDCYKYHIKVLKMHIVLEAEDQM